jgi:hypothetical protein
LLLELEERGNNNQNIVLLNCRINKEEWEKIVETQRTKIWKKLRREANCVWQRRKRERVSLYPFFFQQILFFIISKS